MPINISKDFQKVGISVPDGRQKKGQQNKEKRNMGMGASQVRLLALTSRQHDIGRQLVHYSNEKQSLTREMQKISKDYNLALQGKVLKWSNNAGVDYVDLTYSTLMRPNSANGNKPVLLTNSAGKLVIDQKYKKYAEMVSADGKAGGDWKSNRIEILSALTGISAQTLETAAATEQDVYDSYNVQDNAAEYLSKIENSATPFVSANQFAKYWGNVGGHDFKKSGGKISLGSSLSASSKLISCVDDIKTNMKEYLTEEDYEKFETACDSFTKTYSAYIKGYKENSNTKSAVENNTLPIQGNSDNFRLDVGLTIDAILAEYITAGGTYNSYKGNETFRIVKNGVNSESYQKYLKASQDASEKVEDYKTKVDIDNQVLTADQESLIAFYDQLFTAVAENGWTEDTDVYNPEYLNQMLQNNEYCITNMTKNEHPEELDANGQKRNVKQYNYSTDLWSNTDNIFAVNDEYTRQEALTDYEYKKSIINAKESRVDERMRNLETEQSAIKQMIQGIEQVRNNNIETYFNIFT